MGIDLARSARQPATELETVQHPWPERWLRWCTAAGLLLALVIEHPWRWAGLDHRLQVPLDFGGGVVRVGPDRPAAVAIGCGVLAVACLTMACGRWVRASAFVAAVTGCWVLGVPQLFGKVNHYHHLIWLALVIALLPRTPIGRALAVRAAWVLIGVAYFVAGVEKLRVGGTAWVTTPHLERLVELLRYDKGGSLLSTHLPDAVWIAGAVMTVLFEVGFIVVALTSLRRPWAVSGLLFHLGIALLAGLWFWPMLVIYPLLLTQADAMPSGRWPRAPVAAVGALIVVIVLGSLTLSRSSWPVAPYPAFEGIVDTPYSYRLYAEADGELRRVGSVLAPWATPERAARLEKHDPELLDRLVTADLGYPVRIVARIEDVRTGAVVDEATLTT